MKTSILLLVFLLLLLGSAYAFQGKLIYHPREYGPPFDKAMTLVKRIPYDNGQGASIAFYYGPERPKELWLLFGGNGMLALDWLWWIYPRREILQEQEWGFLMIDYPGYGLSAGKPDPDSIHLAVNRAYRAFLEPMEQTPSLNVLAISLGTGIGLRFAAERPPKKLVLLAPHTSLQDLACEYFFWPLCKVLSHHWDNRLNLRILVRTEARILLLHGAKDQIIPSRMGQSLAEEHPERIEFQLSEQAGHNDLLELEGARILEFMRAPP